MISLTARVCKKHPVISLNQEKSIGNSSKFDRGFILLDCFDFIQVYSPGGYFTINSYGGVRRKDFCYDPIPEIWSDIDTQSQNICQILGIQTRAARGFAIPSSCGGLGAFGAWPPVAAITDQVARFARHFLSAEQPKMNALKLSIQYHIISYHIISYHIISYHIISSVI